VGGNTTHPTLREGGERHPKANAPITMIDQIRLIFSGIRNTSVVGTMAMGLGLIEHEYVVRRITEPPAQYG